MDKKSVGLRIKYIRENLGLPMSIFGEKFNEKKPIKSGVISNWENGKQLPNKERIKIIAELGNVSIPYLLYGEIEEIINQMTDEAFLKNDKLSFLDKNEIANINIQDYSALHTKAIHTQKLTPNITWNDRNEIDTRFYAFMINEFEKELTKIEKMYDDEFGIIPVKYKKVSDILQDLFYDQKAMQDFIIDVYNRLDKSKLHFHQKNKLYNDSLDFFSVLFQGHFRHYEYHREPQLYDSIGTAIINGYFKMSYDIELDTLPNWNRLTKESKEKVHAQISSLAETMINHELNDQTMTDNDNKED